MERALGRQPDLYKADPEVGQAALLRLEMLPYPSGRLHMGHVRNYSIGDALARYMWMQRLRCPAPHGLGRLRPAGRKRSHQEQPAPARLDALQHRAHEEASCCRWASPTTGTREISTCEPEYYRWNQWFFLKMLERGLAYRKKSLVNWCPRVRHGAGQRTGGGRLLLAP